MFNKVNGVWGFLGVSLFLVAIFLVLNNGTSSVNVISATSSAGNSFFKTLQGR